MEKEYLVLTHNLDAGASGLLGEYNSEDKYEIADNLKQELKIAKKLITEYKPDKIKAIATVGSFSFDFVIFVQLGEQNKKRATLFLQEQGKILGEEKEMLSLISSVIVEASQNFLEVIKKEFNLFIADESTGIDMSNSNLFALIAKKEQVLKRAKFLKSELVVANRAYVLKMLSLIKASGEYGDLFLMQFKNLIQLNNISKKSDDYWNKIKVLLDKMLIENESVFPGPIKQRMEQLQKIYINAVLNAKEPVVVKSDEKKPKKDESKKTKKPGGKGTVKKKSPTKNDTTAKNNVTQPLKPTTTPVKISGTFRKHRQHTQEDKPQNPSLSEQRTSDRYDNLMRPIFDKTATRGFWHRKTKDKTAEREI